MRIGIECGGTFTDVVVLDDEGNLRATDKVFSTPSAPSEAVGHGLRRLPDELRDGTALLHGSTVATNALIERKGATIGLIVTRGFRDLVFLQRQDRAKMYDLTLVSPQPLVTRDRIVEVTERIAADGTVRTVLDEASVKEAIEQLVARGVEAVAVSLLHSYVNPTHERRIAEIAAQSHPDLTVAVSSTSAREFREYERTTTTTVDAFLRPRVSGYLRSLETEAADLGIADLQVMQSNGGIVPVATAAANPLSMLRSGPAAGVAGAIAVATNAGFADIVTMDMGGTSTDVAVVHDGRPEQTAESTADGLPVRVAMVDIVAVGAGGGSLVGVDSGGLLTVGPESAGADPGPVCYGKGGTELTVTDANLVRGLIRPEAFLGGRHPLDREASVKLLGDLAATVGKTAEEFAEDVSRLASIHMASAIRIATTERGHEVQNYTLVAYGGAGALHAAAVAEELGMPRVLVPPHAGLASAYGLLTAGFQREYAQTHLIAATAVADLSEPRAALTEQARTELADQGIDLSDAEFTFAADMRYRGQGFEVTVDLSDDVATVRDLVDKFHQVHARRYGHAELEREVQVVTLRLTVRKPRPPAALPRIHVEATDEHDVRTIIDGGEEVSAPFKHRSTLAVGAHLAGPAVIEDDTSTIFIPSGWTARVDDHTNVILERSTR
ncbi:hydantoinase/oxoprolinase family protein [Nocardioides sp. NPDC004968]|uniref:hydantoinase/oxoprolinase family protein n=1 Tax=Nocardioides sp. NPDC004968 TaxID=3155894 RepID=UPI0033B28F70